MRIYNARVILEDRVIDRGSVRVTNGVIVAIEPDTGSLDRGGRSREDADGEQIIDAQGLYLGPGFVELHIHGCNDVGFEAREPDLISRVAAFLAERGVTTFVPTLQCNLGALRRLSAAIAEDGAAARRIPGLYVEGPFVSRAKRGGILEETIRPPDPGYLELVLAESNHSLRLMTVAPELSGIGSIANRLVDAGIVPCWGHSECTVDQIPKLPGVRRNITHLFNGMSPVSHKEAGLAMVPFVDPETYFELNADGVHVNSEAIRMCYGHLNLDRMILISDAVVSAGRSPGEYRYFDRPVISGEDGVRYTDGTLIGSNRLIPEVVRRFIDTTGCPVPQAVRLATLNPCRLLSLDEQKGSIAVGKEADLVLFDDEFTVKQTFLAG